MLEVGQLMLAVPRGHSVRQQAPSVRQGRPGWLAVESGHCRLLLGSLVHGMTQAAQVTPRHMMTELY